MVVLPICPLSRTVSLRSRAAELIAEIQSKSDVVINLTTGGSPHMSVEERIGPAVDLAPELASLNMGTMNMGLFPMLDRFPEQKYDWERKHLGNVYHITRVRLAVRPG